MKPTIRDLFLPSQQANGLFMATEDAEWHAKGSAFACFVPEAWYERWGVLQVEFSQYGLRRHMDLNPARPTKLKPKAS